MNSLRARIPRPRALGLVAATGSRCAALAFAAPAILAACARLEPSAVSAPLSLTHVRPSNAEGLFLNEELVFYFSDEIEPMSVTSASVAILSEAGIAARGRLEVDGEAIRFVPEPVLAKDLSDGGFLPGTRYTVTLTGFPCPEGLRSLRGALLDKTRTWSFRTVDVDAPRERLVFEDRSQDHVGILRIFPASTRPRAFVGSRDSIYLTCDKPLDPSTVLPAAFRLLRHDSEGRGSRAQGSTDRVEVRVRLLENHPDAVQAPRPPAVRSSIPQDAWERERRACLIEVTPEAPLITRSATFGSDYRLRIDGGSDEAHPLLRDFSGNPVLVDAPADGLEISVSDEATDQGRFREEFDTKSFRSAIALPGYDGTAAWGETGRVTVRFPAAAGLGSDGHVVLGEKEDRTDVQGVSLELPEGTTCRLLASPGLVVLRSQGRMSIRGKLMRDVAWDPQEEIQKDPTRVEWYAASRLRGAQAESSVPLLSDWLEAAREGNWNWTVLIAGGDLFIESEFTCTTPLLLVAGGTVRISGSVRGVQKKVMLPTTVEGEPAEAADLGGVFLLRDSGGGFDISPAPRIAWLLIDEPQGSNPLVEPLRFAALSAPIPARGNVLRWLTPEIGAGPMSAASPATPRWRIRYLPEVASAPRVPADLAPVDDPVLLNPPGPIQFLIELEVVPGGLWTPPWIDYVDLAWEQSPVRPRSPIGGR